MPRPAKSSATKPAQGTGEGELAQGGGELALIDEIARRASEGAGGDRSRSGGLILGIGDDCAVLRPPRNRDLVVTTDFSLEARHFRRDWHSPYAVGHRTLARGLSDLAAMGARPLAAFLSLALPTSLARDRFSDARQKAPGSWVSGFLDGLLALAAEARVPLAGGDTAGAPGKEVLADIVLLGTVARGRALRRAGARAGDRLYVTGSLGGSAAELHSLGESKQCRALQAARPAGDDHPHLFPQPRLRAGQWLAARGRATAAIDVSDGLSTDLHHLCTASGVRAEVETERLPLHPLLHALPRPEALHLALHGGEDYELLFTVPAGVRVPPRIGKVAVTEIGRMLAPAKGQGRMTLVAANGKRQPLRPGGWEHLR